jgi:hypothetical protein
MDEFDNMIRGRRGRVSDLNLEPDMNPLTALIMASIALMLLTALVTTTAIVTARLLGVE